jgi:hypothetical protein
MGLGHVRRFAPSSSMITTGLSNSMALPSTGQQSFAFYVRGIEGSIIGFTALVIPSTNTADGS